MKERLFNLSSSLPEPVKREIPLDDLVYVQKLKTSVFFSNEYNYIHVYKKCEDCYRYQQTFKII